LERRVKLLRDSRGQLFWELAGNASVSVDTNLSSCNWTASENLSWVSISPGSGSGEGSVTVNVSANTGSTRSGSVTIAGRPFSITQDAQSSTTSTIALINPDNYRILKFGFGQWPGEHVESCEGSGSYYSAAYGTIQDSCSIEDSNCWSSVGQQPDFIAEVLRDNGYSVDEFSTSSFPDASLDDYDVVFVQDPLVDNYREFPRSVESSLPDLLDSVANESFVNKLKSYFDSGGKLILVGDAVRLLEPTSTQKSTLNFGKTILTDQVANSSSSDCVPEFWPVVRGNPFCCVDRNGSFSYEVYSTTLSLDSTNISDLDLFNGNDVPRALIWSDTVYYPEDGTSLLDIKVSGTGDFVTEGSTCSPPVFQATIDDVLSNFMGYTEYNGSKIFYIGSDSFWDYHVRNYAGAWHCSDDNWSEIKNQISVTGKDAIIKLVQTAILDNGTFLSVPDVVGLSQVNAESAITSAGLIVGTITTTYNDSVSVGNVISQSPTGGNSVVFGSSVDIVISLGINDGDNDADNDGVLDEDDAFPLDPNESSDTDEDGIGDNADNDDDNDSISDSVESAGPNNGDANNDGIQDSLQNNVVCLKSYTTQEYIILETLDGITLSNCQTADNPSPGNTPAEMGFDYGFYDFTISGLAPGGSTTLTMTLPSGTTADTYYKYGQTPSDQTDHWYEFLYDNSTGAKINGNVITLYFTDALRGDDVIMEDSKVIDLGAPGFKATDPDPDPDNGGGCFIDLLRY